MAEATSTTAATNTANVSPQQHTPFLSPSPPQSVVRSRESMRWRYGETERDFEVSQEPTAQQSETVYKRFIKAGKMFLDTSLDEAVRWYDLDMQTQFAWLNLETRGTMGARDLRADMAQGRWSDFTHLPGVVARLKELRTMLEELGVTDPPLEKKADSPRGTPSRSDNSKASSAGGAYPSILSGRKRKRSLPANGESSPAAEKGGNIFTIESQDGSEVQAVDVRASTDKPASDDGALFAAFKNPKALPSPVSYDDFNIAHDSLDRYDFYEKVIDKFGKPCFKIRYLAAEVARHPGKALASTISGRMFDDFEAAGVPMNNDWSRKFGASNSTVVGDLNSMVASQRHGTMPLLKDPDLKEFLKTAERAKSLYQSSTSRR